MMTEPSTAPTEAMEYMPRLDPVTPSAAGPDRRDAPTIEASLRDARHRLAAAGIEDARAEARYLLSHVLGMDAAAMLAHGDRPLRPEDVDRIARHVERRAAREPFAYLVGEREFYGRPFMVDCRVLIPRSETETLVEAALDVLRTGHDPNGHDERAPLVIDVGTGSGAIACTLALEAPWARLVACDVSQDALAVAAENRRRLGPIGRLSLVRGSLLDWLGRPADLIVANLPYLPTERIPGLAPEVADHEPRLALDGGWNGAALMLRLLADIRRTVKPGGTLLFELDPEQVDTIARAAPWGRTTIIQDLAGLDRVLRIDLPDERMVPRQHADEGVLTRRCSDARELVHGVSRPDHRAETFAVRRSGQD
ncbi:MAG: peptide chain release factor N(5)-glutamine methyltransferase [Chloroflexi bacterium]|nr:peptide chain release factor N(5)-glutamine methyltransferase [Chloroflexota bacterium]